MKVGDRVTKDRVHKTDNPIGTIANISQSYVVVKWDNIPGMWHYTPEQTGLMASESSSRGMGMPIETGCNSSVTSGPSPASWLAMRGAWLVDGAANSRARRVEANV